MKDYNTKKKQVIAGKVVRGIKNTPGYAIAIGTVAAAIIPISIWWTYNKLTNNNSPNDKEIDSDD